MRSCCRPNREVLLSCLFLFQYLLARSSFNQCNGPRFDFRLGHKELRIYLVLVCLINITGKVSGEGDVQSGGSGGMIGSGGIIPPLPPFFSNWRYINCLYKLSLI